MQITLGAGTTSPEEVLLDFYVDQPLEAPGWSLGCDAGYRMPWPAGTRVWSTKDHVRWPVELTLAGGQPDEKLYVQGPFERAGAPELGTLVGAGSELVGRVELRGARGVIEAIELRYVHEGAEWRQWRYLVPLGDALVALVTAQASSAGYHGMLALGKTIAAGLC